MHEPGSTTAPLKGGSSGDHRWCDITGCGREWARIAVSYPPWQACDTGHVCLLPLSDALKYPPNTPHPRLRHRTEKNQGFTGIDGYTPRGGAQGWSFLTPQCRDAAPGRKARSRLYSRGRKAAHGRRVSCHWGGEILFGERA